MDISSRTPEGVPNHCPICHADIQIIPSQPSGDAPCPNCGALLWFTSFAEEGTWYFDPETVAPVLKLAEEIVSETLRADKDQINASTPFPEHVDSLDLVELVMALESQFDIFIPEDELRKMHTVADLVGYILRNRP